MQKANNIKEQIFEKVKEYYNEVHKVSTQNYIPGKSKVNYAGRVFNEDELLNLVDSSLDFWLTAGKYSEEFAMKLSHFFGLSEVILVNSGSSANLVAITALTSYLLGDKRLLPGDEVITVAAGFPSTVAPIIQNNLIPVFVDVDINTYNAVTEQILQAISPKTKAVFIAHTLGIPYDVEKIREICDAHGLWLVEDNCDAVGSRFNGKLTGTFGHIATVSFYPAHHITTGEGGCVITDDALLGRIAKSIRDWGRDCYCEGGENNTCGKRFTQQFGDLPVGYDHKYVYSHLGYNLKMTDMQAAIGSAQMDKLEGFIEARKQNYTSLFEGLKKFNNYLLLPKAPVNADPSWFGFVISVIENAPFTRNELTSFLENNLIETRNLFSGNLLRHPAFKNITCRVPFGLDTTDYIMNNTFFIGVYPGLTSEKIEYIVSVFDMFFKSKN